MALQNRVTPAGDIVAHPARGLFMGNRGGRVHDPDTRTLLPTRRWASRQWICCVLKFKNRHRAVMAPGQYTHMFFLDEVTALAAGHRPCFECRRREAVHFAECWGRSRRDGRPLKAPEMDHILQNERVIASTRTKKTLKRQFDEISHGSMVEQDGKFIARHGEDALLWTWEGYEKIKPPKGWCNLLTPASIDAHVFAGGYEPGWHPSVST